MQGKAIILVVALLIVVLVGLITGIAYLLLSDRSDGRDRIDDSAIITDGDLTESGLNDNSIPETTESDKASYDEPNDEITHDLHEAVDFTGHPLIGTWKNTLDEMFDVDISLMETTLEFRVNGVAIRESVNISFRYEWIVEYDVLYMKSFGAWGNTHNPENDRIYKLIWITPDSFSIDFYNNDEMVIFERVR